jgi:hypothetical protein
MRVVIHTGSTPAWAEPLGRPWPLLPVGNRPWLEYWIEWCVAQEARQVHIVLGDGAHEIEDYLGDGSRWGLTVQYSFHRQVEDPDAFLRRDPDKWRDGLLYVRRPVFPRRGPEATALLPPGVNWVAQRPDGLDVFCSREAEAIARLGQGEPVTGHPFPADALTPHALTSLQAYFDLNMDLVKGEIAHYLTPGYRREDNAYLGYNVIYPAAARLTSPLMIGNDVRIQALASVGPCTILGNRVIVDRQAEVSDSIVFDGTYLGAGIELKGRIAAGRRLIDPSDGTALDLDDIHLLAPLRKPGASGEKLRRLVHRLLALLLFIVTAPAAVLLLLVGYLRGGRLHRVRILGVRGPCTIERWNPGRRRPGLLLRLSLHEWPLLLRVARGQLWLCGQLPVTPEEEAEVRSWPTYRPGLFSYADTRADREDPVRRRIDAIYYAHHRGWVEDLRILWHGWWGRLSGRNHTSDEPGGAP